MQSIPISMAQTLQQHILSGHYPGGSQLPPQRELARQLGISRASLREALSMLEALGLVEIQPGKGVRINGPHSGRARMHRAYATPALGTLSPRQLIELRLVLEPGWAALAAVRADDSGLRQLQWTQSQLAHALDRSDLLAAADADLQFHLLLAQLSGNRAWWPWRASWSWPSATACACPLPGAAPTTSRCASTTPSCRPSAQAMRWCGGRHARPPAVGCQAQRHRSRHTGRRDGARRDGARRNGARYICARP